ncbi:MAG: hypothetical protein IIW88_09410, partial [Clostridia bacterium]|nr:hypothetical protein [Clostridia bacterium]
MKKTAEYENEFELIESELTEEKTPYEKWGRIIFFGAVSFLFAQIDFLYGISPFTVAFLGAIPFEFCFSAFVGGTLGGFTSLAVGDAVKTMGALFIVALMRSIKERYFRKAENDYINGIFSLIGCLSCSLIKAVISDLGFENGLLIAFEC